MNIPLRALRRLLPVLALLLPAPLFAAGFACAPSADSTRNKSGLDELDEVIITAKDANTDTNDLRAWLRRLAGHYSYEGYVDLCGKGNSKDQRPVTGTADCTASGATPNIQCTVNVQWPIERGEDGLPVPGGISHLSPAHVLYSIENRYIPEERLNRWGLLFMQIDSKGRTEWTSGLLTGHTFTSRGPCAGVPAPCQKITRITAKPNSKEISMLIDTEIDRKLMVRQAFLLTREARTGKSESSGKPTR